MAKGGRADAYFRPAKQGGIGIIAELTEIEPLPEMQGTLGVMCDRLRDAVCKMLLPEINDNNIELVANMDEIRKPWLPEQMTDLVARIRVRLLSANKDVHGIRWATIEQDNIKVAVGLSPAVAGSGFVGPVRVETKHDLRIGTCSSMRHALSTNNKKLVSEKNRLGAVQSLLVLDAWDLATLSEPLLRDTFAAEWSGSFSGIDYILVARFLGKKPSFFPLKK